ncbi:MAG TPA: site-2 protease family protein [Polyangia bacterium]|nr:site-2 protease family protein [Polyangia bacterium]
MTFATGAVRAGKVAGIEVRLDWSLIVIFWLILVNLSVGTFALDHPDWSAGLRWGTAAVAAVLFLLSVLAHELAHALVGRAQGVEIAGITLFMFGGVARTKQEPQSPRVELLMTVVGPLTSIALGFIALLIGLHAAPGVTRLSLDQPFHVLAGLGPLATLLLWLGPVNIVIGLFNLVPAFPLDGGRLFRAALWAMTGDLRKATRWASGIGQAFAMLFILAGVSMILGLRIPFFGRGLVPGIWIAFIGWFLHAAARASYTQMLIHDLLEGVQVSRLMHHGSLVTAPPDLSVSTFVDDRLMVADQRAFPVMDGGQLLGIVTATDVRRTPRAGWDERTVRDIMTDRAHLVLARPQEEAVSAFAKLAARDVEQLPVVDDQGRLVGLFRRRDVVRWLDLQMRGGSPLRHRTV